MLKLLTTSSLTARLGRGWLALSCVLLLVANNNVGHAQTTATREDQFRAAYLINFVSLVEWPAGTASETLTICFLGGKNILSAISTGIEKKLVGTRRLAVSQVAKVSELVSCNAVYLDASTPNALQSLHSLSEQPILTVSDVRDFAKLGGMIELFMADNRLRFNINVVAANKANLKISSKLLQLAVHVEKGESP